MTDLVLEPRYDMPESAYRRRSPKIYEWVHHSYYNKVYARVSETYDRYLGPRKPSEITISDGRKFKTSGVVSKENVGWVSALFYNQMLEGVTHNIRRHPAVIDGRSSLNDISYAFFGRTELIEMCEVKNEH